MTAFASKAHCRIYVYEKPTGKLARLLGFRPFRELLRQELLDIGWGGHASSNVLSVTMREIRQALADTDQGAKQQVILTKPRQGYCFSPSAGLAAQPPVFRLVGREAEQAQLKQCFTRARTSKRQVVLINGEPGIGKTVLVEDCVRVLRHERNVSIFQGACSATAGDDTAYHPILSAIEGWHRHAAPAERERLVSVLKQHAPHWLAQFPSFMSVEEHERLTGRLRGATQEAMLRHLGNAFEAFAAQRSVVLILEDLHWSDSATLELLTEMARRTGPAKLLLLGTYRPQEVRSSQHPLAPHSALQQIAQDMPLVGLTQELMATYLDQRFPGHAFPEAFLPILSERTQGNPLFLVNMLQDLQEQEKLLYQERHWKLTATLDDIRESHRCSGFMARFLTVYSGA